jgi:hypothetical protein
MRRLRGSRARPGAAEDGRNPDEIGMDIRRGECYILLFQKLIEVSAPSPDPLQILSRGDFLFSGSPLQWMGKGWETRILFDAGGGLWLNRFS